MVRENLWDSSALLTTHYSLLTTTYYLLLTPSYFLPTQKYGQVRYPS